MNDNLRTYVGAAVQTILLLVIGSTILVLLISII